MPYSPRVTPFPDNLGFSKARGESFRTLHTLLGKLRRSKMGIENTDLYSVQQRLKNRVDLVFRFLWVVGRHGKLISKPSPCIVIGSAPYYENRKGVVPGTEEEMDIVFRVLEPFGLKGKLVPLMKDQWKTDKGNLRQREKGGTKSVWQVELIGEKVILKALHEYIEVLDERLGNRAYAGFTKVDMRPLARES